MKFQDQILFVILSTELAINKFFIREVNEVTVLCSWESGTPPGRCVLFERWASLYLRYENAIKKQMTHRQICIKVEDYITYRLPWSYTISRMSSFFTRYYLSRQGHKRRNTST